MTVKTFDDGIYNFLSQKHLSLSCISKFVETHNIPYKKGLKWYCFDDEIQANWAKFHTWVDKALKEGIITGERVKLFDDVSFQRELAREKAKKQNWKDTHNRLESEIPDNVKTICKSILKTKKQDIKAKMWRKYCEKFNIPCEATVMTVPRYIDEVHIRDLTVLMLQLEYVIPYLISINRLNHFIEYVSTT